MSGSFSLEVEDVGEALVSAFRPAMGNGLTDWVHQKLIPGMLQLDIAAARLAVDPSSGIRALGGLRGNLSFDRGGMVPGYIGQPQFAIVHGGEEVRTPAQQAAATDMRGGERRLDQVI